MAKPVTLNRSSVLLCLSLLLVLVLTGCSLPQGSQSVAMALSGPPIISLASPIANATYLQEVPVNIQVGVSNAGSDIDRVEISVNNQLIATVPSPNPDNAAFFTVTQTWPADTSGQYTISATAYRTDGTTSSPAVVNINVTDTLPVTEPTETPTVSTPTVEATATTAATAAPTNTPQPESSPVPQATATSSVPMVTPRDDIAINVRRGPGTNFEPPLGVLAAGQSAEILAVNPPGSWYKIRFGGGEGWVYFSIVDVSGDTSTLPRDAGPATPAPTAAPTQPAVQPTVTGSGGTVGGNGPNLVISGFEIVPRDPFCNQQAEARVNVTNAGNQATTVGTNVTFISVDDADRQSDYLERRAEIPALQPGENFLVVIGFQDNSGGGKTKSAIAIVDSDQRINETNETDNASPELKYVLGVPPDC
jgi:hypothetical protein